MKSLRKLRYAQTVLLFVVALSTTPLFGWLPAEIMPEPPMSNSSDVAPHYDNLNSRLFFGGDFPSFGIYYSTYGGSNWSTPLFIDLHISYPGDMIPSHPFITSDGQVMYFTSMYTENPTEDLYYSEYGGGIWGTPICISSISNNNCDDSGPSLNDVENILYFASIGRAGGAGEWDIWASTWTGNDWGTPMLVNVSSASGEVDPFYHDGTLYFSSNRSGGFGRWDIWAAAGSGTVFGAPYNLGSNINTSNIEKGPSIAPYTFPGSSFVTLLFDSYRSGSDYFDIYTSENEISELGTASWGTIKASFE